MDLLGRAKKLLKTGRGNAPTGPQYYYVACPEGHVIRGLRTEGYQAIRCPTCGDGIFVLPRSPLPNPPAPSTLRPRRRAPVATVVEDEPIELAEAPPQNQAEDVVWLDTDEAAETPEPARPAGREVAKPSQRAPAAREPTRRPPRPSTTSVPDSPARPTDPPARPVPDRPPARSPSPPRPSPTDHAEPIDWIPEPAGGLRNWAARHRVGLVLVGVLLLVGLTVGYRVWLQRWEKLPQIAETNWREGRSAFDLGHFDEAKQKLAIAASSFERLGIADERKTLSRQLADEAAILADRCPRKLNELVEEAARFQPVEEWPKHFATLYKGQSVVFDTTISATPADSQGGSYEIDHRIFVGRGPVPSRQGRIDLQGFRLFETLQPQLGEAKIFGARLDSLRLADGLWIIHLEPESGVLMTNFKALEQTDWIPSETAASAREDRSEGELPSP